MSYSDQLDDLKACNVFIVTVPTPIDRYKRPDLSPLESASRSLGKVLKAGDVAIFESTVYPGATEEVASRAGHRKTIPGSPAPARF